jgi:H+/Cl- antiporter ClcA
MLQALVTGLAAGGVIGFFRLAYTQINSRVVACVQAWPPDTPQSLAVLAGALALLAVMAWLLLRHEPIIGGSGIPQVELVIQGHWRMRWARALWTKFLGTLISLTGGLSVGREGPCIMMGAAVGMGVSRLWHDKNETMPRYLIGGSVAGLAAAFGAPVAGLCFAFEEMKTPLSPPMLLFTSITALSAWLVIDALFDYGRVFPFALLSPLVWQQWWIAPAAGAVMGMFGAVYNRAIVGGTLLLDKARLPSLARAAMPFFLSAFFLLCYPQVLVGFGPNALDLENLSMPLTGLLLLLCVKALFSCASFASGVSGGLLMPMLLVGALGGALLASVLSGLNVIAADQNATIIVLGMAGLFSATVRAPLTGAALLAEMSGAFSDAPLILITAYLAALTANCLGSPPIYESLKLRLRAGKGANGC